MNRPSRCHSILACMAGLSLALCVSVAVAQTPTLRVMTYNVRYASDSQPNAWSDRLPVAKAMLDHYKPDVIGMQEALYRQVLDFATALPGHAWIGLGREGGSHGEFMAVFYRADRLRPLEYDHFWLSDTPNVIGSATWGNSYTRMVTWVLFHDQNTGKSFYFLNTHFDHQVQEAREKSAELVRERATQFSDVPMLLVGDFNTVAETSTVYQTLVGKDKFADTWVTASRRGEEIGTFHGFRGTPRGRSRIDWILSRGPVATEFTEIITFEQNAQFPSDHFPVMADVVIEDRNRDP